METTIPTTAYALLESSERQIVDEYVNYVVEEQNRKRERIIHGLALPIPSEYIRRSKSALYKPLLRAAVAERIQEAANHQDLSPSRVVSEHAAIAFSDYTDYIESNGFGEFRVKDAKDIPEHKRKAVKSIETKPGMYGLSTKLVLHDKQASLRAMAEMMGLIAPDKPPALEEYVKPVTVDDSSDSAPEEKYKELLESV